MGGIIKLIAENAILSLKMFDNVLLNLIVLALIWKYSYVPAWKVTKFLYNKKIIKKKDSGKSSHWLVRGITTYIIFWLIKIPLVLAIYIENDIVETQAIDTTKDAEDRKANYLKRKENRGMIGIPMGIDKLDMILKGMQPKQLITMIAKTGIGKTWFWILVASYCQLNGYRVLFLTTEMAEEQIEDRLEAMLIPMMMGEDFNYGRFKSGTLNPQEEKLYFDFLDMKSSLEPLIVETATGVSNVSAKIEQYQPDVVFIDGAYLMEDDQGAKEDWLRVAHITRDLKSLAKLKKIPICINSQADSTTSKKTGPELENIGFSKAIGHDSDVVLGLLRDEEMIEDKEMKVKVLKQREGTLGNVVLNWDFTTMNFSTLYSENAEGDKESPQDRGLIDIT